MFLSWDESDSYEESDMESKIQNLIGFRRDYGDPEPFGMARKKIGLLSASCLFAGPGLPGEIRLSDLPAQSFPAKIKPFGGTIKAQKIIRSFELLIIYNLIVVPLHGPPEGSDQYKDRFFCPAYQLNRNIRYATIIERGVFSESY